MKPERIVLERDGAVMQVRLNRANKRNALDQTMLGAICEAIETLKTAQDIRAVVLSGDGKAFCAGLDFLSFAAMIQKDGAPEFLSRTHGDANLFQQVSVGWRDLPMPVIAALHGVAFGGGFQIMLGADIRIAAPDTRFSIMEGKWGLVPDMGGMALMPQIARQDVVRRLTYTAEIFGTEKALDWGFITEITNDPLVRATELAHEIANKNPEAVRESKRLITETWQAERRDVLKAESAAQARVIGRKNQQEAVMANFEKRPPVFKD